MHNIYLESGAFAPLWDSPDSAAGQVELKYNENRLMEDYRRYTSVHERIFWRNN